MRLSNPTYSRGQSVTNLISDIYELVKCYTPSRSLRSENFMFLMQSRERTKIYEHRQFYVGSATLWNILRHILLNNDVKKMCQAGIHIWHGDFHNLGVFID